MKYRVTFACVTGIGPIIERAKGERAIEIETYPSPLIRRNLQQRANGL